MRMNRAVREPDRPSLHEQIPCASGISPPENEESILIVEDDHDFARMLSYRIQSGQASSGFRTLTAGSLAGAVRIVTERRVNLIMLDLGLPDSVGLATFKGLRRYAPDTPIVVISGFDDDAVALEAVRSGAQDFIVKGREDGGVLARVIRYAIERHKSHQKLNDMTSQLREVNERLEYLTRIDPLTELLNRRGLQQALSREIRWAQRHGAEPVILLLDLDDFKGINDKFGYAVGDIIIKQIAERLLSCVRLTDYVARIGGDEFIVLLPQTRFAEAACVAEKMRLAICGRVITLPLGESVHVTGSIGAAVASQETPSIDELLSKMHPILSLSKRKGKNQISYDTPANGQQGRRAVETVLEELRSGTSLFAVKQPIVSLSDRSVVGYEFLTRLPAEQYRTPDVFFRLSAEHNMLTLVDHHCFKSCIKAAAEVGNGACCHINLFPSTLIDIPAEHLLQEMTLHHGRRYCIEISEQQIIGEPSYLMDYLREMKNQGLSIAVDDVGFGHSCLENLILLEPDIIKIDKKCIRNISSDSKQERSLKRLLRVLQALDAEIIAEGVETENDLEMLRAMNVPFGQGYLFGRPE